MIVALADIQARIPQQYRESGWIRVSSDYDSGSVDVEVTYERPETDDEVRNRLVQAAIQAESFTRRTEAAELAQYEALKKKYG